MSKDPAFLFYHEDFFAGVSDMSNDEVGAYIRCLCVQASKGGISEKHMKKICESHDNHMTVLSKFKLNSETNLFENARLKFEKERREAYSKSRANNRTKPNNPKKPKSHMKNTSKTYESHMENEDVNENSNKNGFDFGKENTTKDKFEQIKQIFNEFCTGLPKLKKMTEGRKKMILAMEKEYSLTEIGDVFRMTAESDFLSGRTQNPFSCGFDWIMKPANFLKIIEGNYNNKPNGNRNHSHKRTDSEIRKAVNDSVDELFGVK